jgi:enoyl-CoA hydratase
LFNLPKVNVMTEPSIESCILTEAKGAVGIITLHRPKALNALNGQLITEMNAALDQFQNDPAIGCIILTGSEKAFAAGADIREMKDKTYAEVSSEKYLSDWDHINTIQKPIIAAVAGFALGGGCEFALACDFIIAADTAKFAMPEVTIGIIPGGGGTQRLIRAIGKSKAMEMILTGRMMDANEAERAGLVVRVVAPDQLQEEALRVASRLASFSHPVIASAKATVNAAENLSLKDGLALERKNFHACFALEDQKEGMAAFLEKRPAQFKNK